MLVEQALPHLKVKRRKTRFYIGVINQDETPFLVDVRGADSRIKDARLYIVWDRVR